MWRRLRLLFKVKFSKTLDRVEQPGETLDYSYNRQLELLQGVKKGLAAVVTAKKQLEAQAAVLRKRGDTLETQARQALAAEREDLARQALERRSIALGQADDLDVQAQTLQARQDELVASQRALAERIARFRTEKETIKATYNAAKAMVEIGEATTGLGERMADVGMAMQRARDKTEQMQARAQALDELVEAGALETGDKQTHLDRELAALSSKSQVDEEMSRLKQELSQKRATA